MQHLLLFPDIEDEIRRALANESVTELCISTSNKDTPLTVNDAQRIIGCLETPRFDTLEIFRYNIHNAAVLNVFRNGLPLCTSVKTVILEETQLSNEGLQCLLPAFYNTSVTKLYISYNHIQGQRGGEVIRDLLIGNDTLLELYLNGNRLGREGSIGLGCGLADNECLQKLCLLNCHISNEALTNLLLLSMGDKAKNNISLTDLNLSWNNIEGKDGGQQLTLLLQCFPALKVLDLNYNQLLGPLGARALAPGLAAASHLESLDLLYCHLGNNGVANLIPSDGQVNTSLTMLDLRGNDIEGVVGGENVLALASRCTNLDRLIVLLSPDQRCSLNLLLDRKRLVAEAQAIAGSPFPILFRFVEKAHHHEHGLSAIFVILQNDGDDYFCTALNREIEE